MNPVLNYFMGDSMAADAWCDKYQMKDTNRVPVEETPTNMHRRLAKEFAKIEDTYRPIEENAFHQTSQVDSQNLSEFGRKLFLKRVQQSREQIADELFSYFDRFSQIVPQGSIMSNLGNPYVFGSLSNCFGIAPPNDSYGSIMRADQELVQLMKRRGGVGTHLNNLRFYGSPVSNASKSSTGAPSFAERFSNSTREVAQEGRRGALMELLICKHPDIFRWVTMKKDKTKVTGANVSVMFTDEFMKAVEVNGDFICRFPVDVDISSFVVVDTSNYTWRFQLNPSFDLPYNEITKLMSPMGEDFHVMKIRARELFELFVEMNWDNAEPGAAYIDTIVNYSPDGVYEQYIPELCNPCGEQWFHRYDTCRLIALNLLSCVTNPYTLEAEIDFEKLYEIAYMQQRLGDDLVDLEIEYINRILYKLNSDRADITNEDQFHEYDVEINLWEKIKKIAKAGRRTGGGFTALGDMLAAIGVKYGSEESFKIAHEVMWTKMEAELDATIDMAILRGPFEGWSNHLEFHKQPNENENYVLVGTNDFYKMILHEFPEQAKRMYRFGRRNVSWSTVAPTGTVSLMTQTTSGLEPLFEPFYIRRKKINPSDKNSRVDFTDQNGDQWQEYAILHPQFKEWIKMQYAATTNGRFEGMMFFKSDGSTEIVKFEPETLPKADLEYFFKLSPWYGAKAADISWEARVEMNSIIQKFTSNSLSCTVNLPADVSKEVMHNIYMTAWKKGLKGITTYRDGCRSGVLVTDTGVKKDEFGYTEAIERPEVLEADYYYVKPNGIDYAVIIGKLNGNPYEVFAYEGPFAKRNLKGKLIKVASGHYNFVSEEDILGSFVIENIQLTRNSDEKLLTRWASMALRHGANPREIIEQVDKSQMLVTSFAKAVSRVLKNYVEDGQTGEQCPQCGTNSIIYQEGCKKCSSCGHSKC